MLWFFLEYLALLGRAKVRATPTHYRIIRFAFQRIFRGAVNNDRLGGGRGQMSGRIVIDDDECQGEWVEYIDRTVAQGRRKGKQQQCLSQLHGAYWGGEGHEKQARVCDVCLERLCTLASSQQIVLPLWYRRRVLTFLWLQILRGRISPCCQQVYVNDSDVM